MFQWLRKGLLLYVLILVAGGHWLSVKRTTSWEDPLWVAVHPINGDGSTRSARYISELDATSFAPIDAFMAGHAEQWRLPTAKPVKMVLGQSVAEQPPLPPADGGMLGVMWWSLRLRYWAWQVDKGPRPPPSNIDIFVRYFDPDTSPRLAHSLGLQKGLIGVVNAFASRQQAGSNQVIITHELLHTLGASDKYDPRTAQPLYPQGYADPLANPRYPQSRAEIMGGRIPQSAHESQIPVSLNDVTVGPQTAAEIGWRRDD